MHNKFDAKNCIILAFLMTAFTLTTHAQQVWIGPKAGGQVSHALYEDPEYTDQYNRRPVFGWNAGIMVNYEVSDMFSLHTEYFYSRTGRIVKNDDGSQFHREMYNKLVAPMLLRATYRRGLTQYYFNIGPNFSYWLGGKGKLDLAELREGNANPMHYKIKFGNGNDNNAFYLSNPNRLQIGLDIGAGANFEVMGDYIMVDFRATLGHTHYADQNPDYMNFVNYQDNLSFSLLTFSISTAYFFEFNLFEIGSKTSEDK